MPSCEAVLDAGPSFATRSILAVRQSTSPSDHGRRSLILGFWPGPGRVNGIPPIGRMDRPATRTERDVARRARVSLASGDGPGGPGDPRAAGSGVAVAPAASAPRGDLLSQLEQLAQMRAEGVLSDAEFSAAKSKLLS